MAETRTPGIGTPELRGRDPQLGTLAELVAAARAGRGAALTVSTEPGRGRTALIEAAAEMAAAPDTAACGMRVLGVRGVRHESRLPGAGLLRLLHPLIDGAARPAVPRPQAGGGAPRTRGRVASRRRRDPGAGGLPEALRALCDGRAVEPAAVFPAVWRMVAGAAMERPVLVWADDLHWLDDLTRDAVAFLARRVGGMPVAVLLGTHNEHVPIPERDPYAEIPRLALPALDDHAAREILADRLSDRARHIPDDLVAALVELAAGSPLGLVELAGALTDDQLAGRAAPPHALPPDSRLRANYRRRLFRLSADARLLLLMAVADERLDAVTLARAADVGGLDLAELESARAWGLVRVDGPRVTIPDPLVRTSVYADAPLAERRAAHDLLYRVLDPARHRLRRAEHRAALTGEPDARLAAELSAAADEARTAGAFAEAARARGRAAELTPDSAARPALLLAAATDAWCCGRPRHARILLPPAPGPAEAGALRGEIELRDGLPERARTLLTGAGFALLDADRVRGLNTLAYAGEACCVAGDLRTYVQLAERVAGLRRTDEAPDAELIFTHFAGMSASYQGHNEAAMPALRRAAELGEATDRCDAKVWAAMAALFAGADRRAYDLAAAAADRAVGVDAPVRPWALMFVAQAQFWLGRYPQAVATSEAGLRAARAAGQGNCAVDHVAMLALLAAVQGDADAAVRHLDEVTAAAGLRGLDRAGAFTAWAVACLELADDRTADAAVRLRLMRGAGHVHPVVRVMATPHLIEAAVRCGRPAGANGEFTVFERWATTTDSPARLALVARCRALLADDPAEAEEHFRVALGLHRDAGSAFELARTELLYGHRLRLDRSPRAARDHLRSAVQLFEQYTAPRWTDRARQELRAAGETIAPVSPPASGESASGPLDALTPQQATIARLAAGGATNREIAAQLLLSHRTVDHHLRNIFVRLGIRSRVELARFVR